MLIIGDSMKDNKTILPIGSVVLLEKGKKRLLISGYMPVMKKENRVYDYCGILYPEGMVDDEVFFFNHSDIKDVIHEGYKDSEYDSFMERIEDFYVKKAAEKIVDDIK